jgi:hypothetical protein
METGKLPQITINPILSTLAGGNDINNLGTIALLARI